MQHLKEQNHNRPNSRNVKEGLMKIRLIRLKVEIIRLTTCRGNLALSLYFRRKSLM